MNRDVEKVLETLNKIDILETKVIKGDGFSNRVLDIECSEIMDANDTFHLGILVGQTLTNVMNERYAE